MFITEDAGLVSGIAIAAAECSPKVSINVLVLCLSRAFTIPRRADALIASGFSPACRPEGRRYCRMFKKDVKFNGTNSTSPLESTKVSENKLKKGPKATQKTSRKCVKEAKQSEKETQTDNIPARFSHPAGIIRRCWVEKAR
jgi:hypothetical protein